jgi:hypothetical protein
MCIFARPTYPTSIYADSYRYWCLYPQAVERAEALPNGDAVHVVRLWCRHAYPQCAHRLFYPVVPGNNRWVANDIVVPTIAYQAERAALEDLIFIMGGSVRIPGPVWLYSRQALTAR